MANPALGCSGCCSKGLCMPRGVPALAATGGVVSPGIPDIARPGGMEAFLTSSIGGSNLLRYHEKPVILNAYFCELEPNSRARSTAAAQALSLSHARSVPKIPQSGAAHPRRGPGHTNTDRQMQPLSTTILYPKRSIPKHSPMDRRPWPPLHEFASVQVSRHQHYLHRLPKPHTKSGQRPKLRISSSVSLVLTGVSPRRQMRPLPDRDATVRK